MSDVAMWRDKPFTYSEVGATAQAVAPRAFHAFRAERVVGRGRQDFLAVADSIARYGMQRGAGLRVRAASETAQVGTVLLANAWFLGPILIPCRVVYVIDEPTRAGFAYGTLPGHPESGEELFSVELRPDGNVVAMVSGFSRPGRWYSRVGAPLGRAVQSVMTRRYLAAMQR